MSVRKVRMNENLLAPVFIFQERTLEMVSTAAQREGK